MSQDIIKEIEKAIDEAALSQENHQFRMEPWMDITHADSFKQGAAFVLPLLRKAIENDYAKNTYLQWCKLNGLEPNQETLKINDLRISEELLDLLEGK